MCDGRLQHLCSFGRRVIDGITINLDVRTTVGSESLTGSQICSRSAKFRERCDELSSVYKDCFDKAQQRQFKMFDSLCVLNDWFYRCHGCWHQTIETVIVDQGKPLLHRSTRIFGFTVEGMDGFIVVSGQAYSLREARTRMAEGMRDLWLVKVAQMESEEGPQGVVGLESEKVGSTIVTSDPGMIVKEPPIERQMTLRTACNTEMEHNFDSLSDRWMPLKQIEMKQSNRFRDVLKVWNLPKDLYSQSLEKKGRYAPNLVPMATLIYGRYDIEMRFKINANKFMTGKILVSLFHDNQSILDARNEVEQQLMRPHVFIDIAATNETKLLIPFKYHSTFIRNIAYQIKGSTVIPGIFAEVKMTVLSPMKLGVGSATTSVFIKPMYRFVDATYAALSYQVSLIGDKEGNLVEGQVKEAQMMAALGSGLASGGVGLLEQVLKRVGLIRNQDKPLDNTRLLSNAPRPRLGFPYGVGSADATALKLDPAATVPILQDHVFQDDPTTILEIARIPGLRAVSTWKSSDRVDHELYVTFVDPVGHRADTYSGVPTPLAYISSFYKYFRGGIEYRVDFVSNQFHSGSLMLSAETLRDTSSVEDSGCMYNKIFDLSIQKTCTFIVPYIYETPVKGTCTIPFSADHAVTPGPHTIDYNFIRNVPLVKFKIRVLNPLIPIDSATKEIELLIFMRAAENFELMGLIQTQFKEDEDFVMGGNFPEFKHAFDEPSTGFKIAQMDCGEDDVCDQTDVFDQKTQVGPIQTTDNSVRIKDLLRRPLMIVHESDVHKHEIQKLAQKQMIMSMFWWAVEPPGSMWHNGLSDGRMKVPANLRYSIQSCLISLYRYWRGSTRYIIVVHDNLSEPVYVGYVPHATSRRFGNVWMTVGADWHFGATGLAMDIIIPSINPTAHIDVPFDTDSNFCFTSIKAFDTPRPFKETGNINAGHICVTSSIPRKISVFWQAGDDFELALFAGIPKVKFDRKETLQDDHFGKQVAIKDAPAIERQVNVQKLLIESAAAFFTEEAIKGEQESERLMAFSVAANEALRLKPMGGADRESEREVPEVERVPLDADAQLRWQIGNIPTAQMMQESDIDPDFPSELPPQTSSEAELPKGVPKGSTLMSLSGVVSSGLLAASVYIAPKATLCAVAGVAAVSGVAALGKASSTIDKIEALADSFELKISEINDAAGIIMEKICSSFASVLDFSIGTLKVTLFNLVLDLLLAIRDPFVQIPISIIRFFGNICGCQAFNMASFGEKLGDFFKSFFGRTKSAQQISDLGEESYTKKLVGLFLGLIGIATGSMLTSKASGNIVTTILTSMTEVKNISYLNQVIRFVGEMFDVLKDTLMAVLGYNDPKLAVLAALKDRKDVIADFITDAQLILTPLNATACSMPKFKSLVWMTVVQAHQIQKLVIETGKARSNTALLSLCKEVIVFAKEKLVDLAASPMTYTPFSICIEGKPGIGKSHSTQNLITGCLNKIKLLDNTENLNYLYYRTPGLSHWDGYRDQPAVIYDDFFNMNSSESSDAIIGEIFGLVSPCDYFPPMAALPNKGIKANPRLVVMCTNDAFPISRLASVVACPEAVLRRRNLVIRAELKAEFTGQNGEPINFKESEIGVGETCLYTIYLDPKDSTSGSKVKVEYSEMKEYVMALFEAYNSQELIQVRKRLDSLLIGIGKRPLTELGIVDPYSAFYACSEEIATQAVGYRMFPSEIASHVAEVLSDTEFKVVKTQDMVKIPNPVNIFKTAQDGAPLQSFDYNGLLTVVPCSHCRQQKPGFMICRNTDMFHTQCMTCHYSRSLKGREGCALCDAEDGCLEFVVNSVEMEFMNFKDGQFSKNLLNLWKLFSLSDYGVYKERKPLIATMRKLVDMRVDKRAKFSISSDFGEDPRIALNPIVDLPESAVTAVSYESIPLPIPVETVGPCRHVALMSDFFTGSAVYMDGGWCVLDGEHLEPVSLALCETGCKVTKEAMYEALCFWRQSSIDTLSAQLKADAIAGGDGTAVWARFPRWMGKTSAGRRVKDWIDIRSIYDDIIYKLDSPLGTLFKVSTCVAGISVFLYSISKIFKMLKGAHVSEEEVYSEPQIASSGAERGARMRKFKGPRRDVLEFDRVSQQKESQSGVITLPEATSKILKNYYTIRLTNRTGGIYLLIAVGLFEHHMMFPKHYLDAMLDPNKRVEIKLTHGSIDFQDYEPDKERMFVCKDRDMCIAQLPSNFPMVKDITGLFATEADWDKVMPSEIYFIHGVTASLVAPVLFKCDFKGTKNIEWVKSKKDGKEYLYSSKDSLLYNYSAPGACGSILMRSDSTRPIYGFHYCGSGNGTDGEGSGVRVTSEDIKGYMRSYEVKAPQDCDFDDPDSSTTFFPEGVDVELLGTLDTSVYIPTKTKIMPSLISAQLEPPETEPCILSQKDERYDPQHKISPLVAGCAKHGKLTKNFSNEVTNFLSDTAYTITLQNMESEVYRPEVLTFEQAAIGLPYQGYDSVKFTTSAGYPYCMMKGRTTKESWTTITRNASLEVTGVVFDPLVVSTMKEKQALRERGIVPMTMFIDYPKDERKKKAKVGRLGSTRIFCMSPYDYTINMRQYYLHFIAAYQRDRMKQMSAVGINPDGIQWTQLVNHLFEVGTVDEPPGIVALDYSNFGPGFNAQIAKIATNAMNVWVESNVKGANPTVLECLSEECVNSVHIMKDLIYRQVSGSPSGAPWTVIINSEVNKLYIMAAWYTLGKEWCEDQSLGVVAGFKKAVRLIVYGDDLVMSVSKDVREFFNGRTITAYFAEYGIVATDAAKSGIVVKWSTIEEVTFLKRGFKPHPRRLGQWLAPIEETSLKDCAHWIHKSESSVEATVQNADMSVRLSYAHGKEYFMRHRDTINRALACRKLPTISLTWDELDKMIWVNHKSLEAFF